MSLPSILLTAASILLQITSAEPQRGGNSHDLPADWLGKPASCFAACRPTTPNYTYSSLCSNENNTLDNLQKCIADSDCETDQKDDVYRAVAQRCVNEGADITGGPLSDWASSVTSGDPAYPTAWPSNSAWNTHTDDWHNNIYGPFGPNNNNHGWGPAAWSSRNSDWTRGPWTSWWGGKDGCPASDWAGWTSDWPDWKSGEAPWTSWTACTATTTASAVVTVTVTDGTGGVGVVTSTSLGVRVAQRTGGGDGDGNAVVEEGGAGGRVGVVGGAIGVVFGVVLAVL